MECMLERRPQRHYEEEERVPTYSNPMPLVQNRRTTEEKDRHLQKRIAELQAQTQRLERKIGLLKTENDSLKRQKDDQKPLEEKVKTLKKRNAELAAIARRLEEKAKHLQQENMKKAKEEMGQPESDHMKKLFARQRAKDLAEHAKAMLAKDREIEDLRKKCQELADQLSNAEFLGPENVQMYEEKEELVTIIKQAAKERLQMEKQLAKIRPSPQRRSLSAQADAKKLKELETTNETLQKELNKLEKAKEDTEKLEIELTQKKIECETLAEEIKKEKLRNKELEGELQDSAAKNTQLTVQVSDLQHRLQDLEKVSEECNILRLNLTEAQHECDQAKEDRNVLQVKVESLEETIKNLKDSAERLQQLELEHKSTLQQLQEKQSHIQSLQKVQHEAKEEYDHVLQSLQGRVVELQQNCQRQEDRHKELTQELQSLRASASRNNFKHPSNLSSSPHPDTSNQNPISHQLPVEESLHQSNASSLQESSKFGNVHDNTQVDSTKSLDTDKGEDSGMESQKEQKLKISAIEEHRLSVLAKKGPIQVFQAKYSYDPFQHSPNENPDAELPISSGDYVLVYGEMDEDGFFDGELLNGKRGLVPSNFIEKVADEDLSEFHAAMSDANQHDDDSITGNSIQQDLDFDSSEETEEKELTTLGTKSPSKEDGKSGKAITPASHGSNRGSRENSRPASTHDSETEDIDLTDSSKISPSVKVHSQPPHSLLPCPLQLTLDRQLTNSIVISWKPPLEANRLDIKSYHVYIDNEFKSTVKKNERTKALLENVDSRKVHRVSVRCNSNKGQSSDSQCTMLVGKDAVPAPCDLKVCDITPNSAHISWLPGNSNFSHTLNVNGQDVQVVKPGLCVHVLTGLVPSTEHKVTVKAEGLSDTPRDNLSASINFRTPSGGIPEPPLSVQVEAGPQEGTLLLTWLPVTIDTSGFSNGAVVTGYVVYADGRRAKEALGPTNDHIILSSEDFQGFIPRQLLVRTVTVEKTESCNSETVKLPHSLIKEITEGAAKHVSKEKSVKPAEKPVQLNSIIPDISEGDEDIDDIINKIAAQAERDMSPVLDNIQYEEDFVETSSNSELSDIPEEVEEELASEGVTQSLPAKSSPSQVNGHAIPAKPTGAKISHNATSMPHKVAGQPDSSPRQKLSPRIPAIEITRDSSSEQGNSIDVSEEEPDISKSPLKNKKTDTHSAKHSRKEATRGSPSGIQPSYEVMNNGFNTSDEISQHDNHVTSDLNYKNEKNKVNHVADPRRRLYPESHKSNNNEHSLQQELDAAKNLANKGHRNSPGKTGHRHSPANVSPRHSPRGRELSPKLKERGSHSPHTELMDSKSFSDSNANDVSNDSISDRLNNSGVHVPQLDLMDCDDSGDVDSISGEINPPIEDNRIRLFVALFDYDPESMSPNVECLEEELPFKEGQIIKIYGDKDADGFYRGECNGRVGFVPCNMVSEVQVEDTELAEQLLKETQAAFNPSIHLSDNYMKSEMNSEISPSKVTTVTASTQIRRMVALYDYDPQELSPNVDAELELSFRSGDIIMVYGDMDDDGFYTGEHNGQRGLVPSNFLQEAPLSDEEILESASIVSPARRQKWDLTRNWTSSYHMIE